MFALCYVSCIFNLIIMDLMQNTLFGQKVIKSISFDEQEIIRDILFLHANGKDIDCDPTYSIGNFYKKGLKQPKYKFDLTPQVDGVVQSDCRNLPLENESIETLMFDPPFMFGGRDKQQEYLMSKRFTIIQSFDDLKELYQNALKEFYRVLKKNGILIFKCQDFTDTYTTFTHSLVLNWATEIGYNAKDLFIFLSKGAMANKSIQQRHARKYHSYFWVFQKSKSKVVYQFSDCN